MHGIGAVPDKTLVRSAVVNRWPNTSPIVLGVVLVTGIATLDWATGPDVSVSLLYVLAVMAVTWIGTRRHGYLVAALAAVDSLAAHAIHGAEPLVPRPSDIWNAATTFSVLVLTASLLGALRRALLEQRRLAAVDQLTGALNRRSFSIAAERERLRSAREGRPLTVAYVDLDGFKRINDRLGHREGDRMLRKFSTAVGSSIRGSDLFARIGGDEFAILLPATDAEQAISVLERIRATVAHNVDRDPTLTVSIGIATYRFPPGDVDTMIADADSLMYRAKRAGGNRLVGAVMSGPWLRWNQLHLDPETTVGLDRERGRERSR